MASDNVSVQEMRAFVYQEVCQHLGPTDTEALVYTQVLPTIYIGKSALEVLFKLEMMDRYSASCLSPLSQILKRINRNDLAKKVDRYCKSCKSTKKHSSKKDQSLMDMHKRTDYMIDNNLQVTKLQTMILLDMIEELRQSVKDRGGLEQVQALVDDAVAVIENDFQSKLSDVSTALCVRRRGNSLDSNGSSGPTSLSSTSSTEEIVDPRTRSPVATMERANRASTKSNSLPRGIGNFAHKTPLLPPTPPKKPSQQDTTEVIYDDVCYPPSHPSLVSPSLDHYYSAVEVNAGNKAEQSQLVTGRDGTQKDKPHPPVTKPKPKVFRKRITASTVDIDTTLTKDHCTDCSGGSYTDFSGGDTSTGDSGFADANKYLKRPLPAKRPRKPQVSLLAYTPLKAEGRDVIDYYKSREPGKVGEIFELMADK